MSNKLCKYCGQIIPKYRSKYCSKKCSDNYWTDMRQLQRTEFAKYKMSQGCKYCGYNKCGAALEYHHRLSKLITGKVENQKQASRLWFNTVYKNNKVAKEELKKCELVCSNCHIELHYKVKERNQYVSKNVSDN